MTNWPNIQEYRHLEAKSFANPKYNNLLSNSAEGNDLDSVIKSKNDATADESYNSQKGGESKIVRCVIRKDFEENFKKFDRGDGVAVNGSNHGNSGNECFRNKLQESTTFDQSIADKIRLQNHLKWKKQKEIEFLRKKEAERVAQQKKKEEEIRAEKTRKLKEKEREEKIREWQEQKDREKEGKKREKMVMKVLEEEFKEITPVVDKEKLIEEWVKLKDKQRQLEADKKAEILKKEEESRALRQNLAALSYRQWKESLKGRMMNLPKNGYQIFGPKPVPVVKEDWNHNFTSNSPRPAQGLSLRVTKSNITTPSSKEFDDLSSFCLKDSSRKSPSLYHMKKVRSGINELRQNSQCGMPLKELQPGTIGLNENLKNNCTQNCSKLNLFTHDANSTSFLNSMAKFRVKDVRSNKLNKNKFSIDVLPSMMYSMLPESVGKKCGISLSNSHAKKLEKFEVMDNGPTKKKIELYLNTSSPEEEVEENSPIKCSKKPMAPSKNCTLKPHKENKKKEIDGKKSVGIPKRKPMSREKYPVVQVRNKTFVSRVISEDGVMTKSAQMRERGGKKVFNSQMNSETTNRSSRTSRSYDKPTKKASKERMKTKGCFSSRSVKKSGVHRERLPKTKVLQKKRRSAKQSKLSCSDVSAKNVKVAKEADTKARKKVKKKNPLLLPKSLSYTDSPYNSRKTTLTAVPDKLKIIRRKNGGETKSDGAGRCRKSSTTKI